jgi:hypothetical protein
MDGITLRHRERCPECGSEYVRRCRCPRADMECANGHQWWHCRCGKLMKGAADHAKPMSELLCTECKTDHLPLPMW